MKKVAQRDADTDGMNERMGPQHQMFISIKTQKTNDARGPPMGRDLMMRASVMMIDQLEVKDVKPTAVATSIGDFPLRKSRSASSRSPCVRSPWILFEG